MRPQIRYEKERLVIEYGDRRETRPLKKDDSGKFDQWIEVYRDALKTNDNAEKLLQTGREIYNWLNGDAGHMDTLLDNVSDNPLIVEFVVTGRRPAPEALQFLEVPWELLADESGHLAADQYLSFCPVRRIGEPEPAELPSEYRLSAVFMAAEPENGGSPLNYEAEEAGMIEATGYDPAINIKF